MGDKSICHCDQTVSFSDEGYNPQMLGCELVKKALIKLQMPRKTDKWQTEIDKRAYSRRNTADEISKLLATGKFVRCGNGIAFSQPFAHELFNAYPEQSIEEGIRKAGIDPVIVGYQRMYQLERSFNGESSASAGLRNHTVYS